MYRLIFKSGPQRGRRLAIRQGPVILGRHPDCAIRLPEPEVAVQHAILEAQPDGRLRIRRLTEGASLRVNHQEVSMAELHDGDVFEIGGHGLEFRGGTAPSAPAIKPSGRHLGWLQRLTILAVGLLLTCQMIFLLTISFLRQEKPPAPDAAQLPAPTSAGPVLASVAVSSNLALKGTTQIATSAPATIQHPVVAGTTSNLLPVRPVAMPATSEAVAFSNEMNKMQKEIGQLQQAVAVLPKPLPVMMAPVATNIPAAAVARPKQVVQPTNAAPEVEDLVLAQAQRMFKRTLSHAAQIEPEQFDAELETIQTMAPDFLPPYLERAQVMEKRGMLAEALALWQQVHNRTPKGDLRARADAEIARLEKRLAAPPLVSKETTPPPTILKDVSPATKVATPLLTPSGSSPATPPVERPVRPVAAHPVAHITQVDAQKLLAGENYDELRLLRITVGAAAGAPPLPPADVTVMVTFFDRGENSGGVAPSRAVVPGTALRASAATGSAVEFTATYQVPRGSREAAARQTGELWRYFGYRVEVFYDDVLQERRDQPPGLLPAP